ncbi:hypothetical protein [Aliihoeflea sp. PC F10.4]
MRLLLIAALVMTSAGSVHASGTISCAGEPDVSVDLTIGSLPVLSIVAAQISVGKEYRGIGADGDQAIVVGQAIRENDRIMVDFTDPNIERIVAELRLFEALEERDHAMAGTLRIAGDGAYALTCVGP